MRGKEKNLACSYSLLLKKYIYLSNIKIQIMKICNFIIILILCFGVHLQAQNKADNFKQQAQSSLEKKDYTKARYLFIQAYRNYAK